MDQHQKWNQARNLISNIVTQKQDVFVFCVGGADIYHQLHTYILITPSQTQVRLEVLR